MIETAPTVAAQLEFWYEDEVKELRDEIGATIHVRVDPLVHPEKVRLRNVAEVSTNGALRVGDEHEVELLAGRLPNASSAAAVIDARIIEVENAASMSGQTARIKLIDVAEDSALAELSSAAAPAEKKKRRRGGRGRRELSAADQTQQLRELAEEAAKFSLARPPIGITTITEEEERADKAVVAEVKGEHAPEAIVISQGEVHEGEGRHRRRRRRRRGRGGRSEEFIQAAQAGIPAHSAEVQAESEPEPAEAGPVQVPEGEGGHRRRRRRRRRHGRAGVPGADQVAAAPAGVVQSVPDRHIFRVAADGSAEPTGETAPREPVRAIAPWNRKVQPPAVEAPPPHLRAPAEGAKPTKPARRPRRTAVTQTTTTRGGELTATPTKALPAAQAPAKTKPARKKPAQAATAAKAAPAESKVKRAPKKADSAVKIAAPAKAKPKTATRKKAAASTTARKTSTAKTSTRKKKS